MAFALIALIFTVPSSVYAQDAANPSASSSNTDGGKYHPGSAWTLSWPLGTHVEASMDTLLYNYQRGFVEALRSDAWATTGQFTGPALNMIYFDRDNSTPFFFDNALSYWIPSFRRQKFYNVYIPFTQLSYGMGYGSEYRTDHLKATFAGNVNRRIGIGAWVDYPYTKGAYASQAAKGLGFGFSGYYAGDRYELQAFFNHWNHVNKENGGITNDLYITNPAELQGGVDEIEPKSIPVNLSDAHNRVTGSEFYMNHAYKLGFWRDITQETDTVERREFVPVTKFAYTFDWKDNNRIFLNDDPSDAREFWKNTYFDLTGTRDVAEWWSVSNTVGVEMVEGFHKWAKFGLSAYATLEVDKYRYKVQQSGDLPDTPADVEELPEGLSPLPEDYAGSLGGKTRTRLWVGGRIEKTRGSIIRYAADARFGLVGDAAGEIDVRGELETRFRLGKDTVRIGADGYFRNLEPNYMFNHYVGNHFIWNNDFGMIRSFRVQGKLDIPWTRTQLRVGFENVQNQVYFNSDCMPAQNGGSVQVFSAAIEQKLRFGIWNWNNTVTYQKSSDMGVIPLPELSVYSNMFLYFHAFRALTVQIGIDCNWYSGYYGPAYQPATMSFHTQGSDRVKIGNFINSDVYLTCKLYKVRFFLMCSNLSQGWFGDSYFSLPHYPIDPRQFRLGLSIDFTD